MESREARPALPLCNDVCPASGKKNVKIHTDTQACPCATTFATFAATTPCNDVHPAQHNAAYCEYRGEWKWALQATPLHVVAVIAKCGKHHGKTGQTRRSAPTHVNVTATANVAPCTGKKKSAKLRPSARSSMNAHSLEVTPLACASGGG